MRDLTLYLDADNVRVNAGAFDFGSASVNLSGASIDYGTNGLDSRLTTETTRAQSAEAGLQTHIDAIQTSLTADEMTLANVSSTIRALNSLIETKDEITLMNPPSGSINNCIDGNNNFIQLVLFQNASSVYDDVLKNADLFDVYGNPTKYLGWTITGTDVPVNTIITNYRYDYDYLGDHVLIITTNNIIPYTGDNSSYTLIDLKVEQFFALQNQVMSIANTYVSTTALSQRFAPLSTASDDITTIKKLLDPVSITGTILTIDTDVEVKTLSATDSITTANTNTQNLAVNSIDCLIGQTGITVGCPLSVQSIRNLSAGVNQTDAVNKSQLDALQSQVNDLNTQIEWLYTYFFQSNPRIVLLK